MAKKQFKPKLVIGRLAESNRDGHWEFQGAHFTGTIYKYVVEDRNFRPAHKWSFQVRVPDKFIKGAYVVVNPDEHPQKSYWAGFERRSINFARATREQYRGLAYVKLNIADATGEKNRVGVSRGERSSLPDYIRKFRLRLKDTVASTQGTDGHYQVAVVNRDDHLAMIRLFFALKVWVMYNEFTLAEQ